MKKKMTTISVFVVLLINLFFACSSFAAITVKVRGRLVPSPKSVEDGLVQLRYERDQTLKLPQCPGDKLLQLYEQTSAFVADGLRQQGELVYSYRQQFANEDVEKMLCTISELEQNRSRILSAIRKYEFACQSQCGGANNGGAGTNGGNGSGSQYGNQNSPTRDQQSASFNQNTGLSLLNLEAATYVNDPVSEGSEVQPPTAAAEIEDPYLSAESDEELLGLFKSFLGMQQSKAQSQSMAGEPLLR